MEVTAQMIGLAIGWLLVGWSGGQGLWFGLRAVRRRLQSRRDFESSRADFRRRVQAAARAARASHALSDWAGWRPFRVEAVVDEAQGVKSFYFTPVDGRPLLPFAPGQYLTFRLPAAESRPPVVRCYSLSDRPRQDYFRATIKRIAPPPKKPAAAGGVGSTYFHERVHVGDVVEARAPAGTFLIDPQAREPVVLIGAGIGVTPLVSMLETYVHTGRRQDVYALFGFRNSGEHPFKERLQRMAETNPWFHLHTSYSAPRPTDVLYRDYNHHGRLTIDRVRAVLPSSNYRFYVCGPGPLMETLVPALWAWGVPEADVHYEAFGPASVNCGVGQNGRARSPYTVRFERSQRSAVWDGGRPSLLELGEAAGVAMPSGCRAGSCGECLVALRSGEVSTIKTPGIAVPAGHCLTCISAPETALVLDA